MPMLVKTSNRGAVYWEGGTTLGSKVSVNLKSKVCWKTKPPRSKPREVPPGAAISM
jgi:hypothetical protein